MARVPSVAQTEQTFRPLATAVRKLAVVGRSCGNCGSSEIRPSNRRNALDIVLACLFLAPFRCRVCRDRFYRIWRPSLQSPPDPPDPPAAPLLVMPARRSVAKADAIPPRRIQPEPVQPQRSRPELMLPTPQLILPALKANVSPPAPLDTIAPQRTIPGSILILETDLSIRKMLRRLLERRGYRAMEVEQAEDLEGELRDGGADLLVIDVSAPGADGVQALLELGRVHPNLKILALSGASLAHAEHADEIPGRFLTLPKPFALDSFLACVDRLLGR
jgi:CheY-like chemotaxis protein